MKYLISILIIILSLSFITFKIQAEDNASYPTPLDKNTIILSSTGEASIYADTAYVDFTIAVTGEDTIDDVSKKFDFQLSKLHDIFIEKPPRRITASDEDENDDIIKKKKSASKIPKLDVAAVVSAFRPQIIQKGVSVGLNNTGWFQTSPICICFQNIDTNQTLFHVSVGKILEQISDLAATPTILNSIGYSISTSISVNTKYVIKDFIKLHSLAYQDAINKATQRTNQLSKIIKRPISKILSVREQLTTSTEAPSSNTNYITFTTTLIVEFELN